MKVEFSPTGKPMIILNEANKSYIGFSSPSGKPGWNWLMIQGKTTEFIKRRNKERIEIPGQTFAFMTPMDLSRITGKDKTLLLKVISEARLDALKKLIQKYLNGNDFFPADKAVDFAKDLDMLHVEMTQKEEDWKEKKTKKALRRLEKQKKEVDKELGIVKKKRGRKPKNQEVK